MNYTTKEILKAIKCTVICEVANKELEYTDAFMIPTDFLNELVVSSIEARDDKVVVHFDKDTMVKHDLNEEWVKAHIKNTGVEPSFF